MVPMSLNAFWKRLSTRHNTQTVTWIEKPSMDSLDIPIRDAWPYTCRRPLGSESMFQKAFRDVGTIWSRGLKLIRSNIMLFCELEKVYLGMEKIIRSSNVLMVEIFEIDPYM